MTRTSKPNKIEFVFPDRMLAYDCESCQDNCCKGHGFGLQAQKEVLTLLQLYPALSPFVSGSNHGTLGVDNFRPGCHFFDRDNLCSIERDLGREMKPLICRLFPTNKLSVYGDTVVVDVHQLCTLGLAAYGGPSAREIAHVPILEEFSEAILATIEAQPRDPHETKLEPFADDLLSLERAVRDRAGHHFDNGDFHGYLLFQSEQTDKALPSGCDRRALQPRIDHNAVRRVLKQMARFFGVHASPLERVETLRLNQILIATSCSVRRRFLADAASEINDAQDFSHCLTQLPWILVSLEFLFRAAVSLNRERNVVATVNDICTKEFALMRVLARFPTTPEPSGTLSKELNLVPAIQRPFFEFLGHLTNQSRAESPVTFFELLENVKLPVHDRATLLSAIDQHAGDLVDWCPSDQATSLEQSNQAREVPSGAAP